MSNELVLYVDRLKTTLGNLNFQYALELLHQITIYFDTELTVVLEDFALERVFNRLDGVLSYASACLTFSKTFNNVNKQCFKLFTYLVQKYKERTSKYANDVIEVCLKYILSTMTSAKEQELAAIVINELVSNGLCQDVNCTELLNKLFLIFNLRKRPGTLLHQVYEIIGLLAREYPNVFTESMQMDRVRDMFLEVLEKGLLNLEETTYAALLGSLNGFRYFLVNFSFDDDKSFIERLYTCIKKLSNPMECMRNRQLFRAALQLLTDHSKLLGEHLLLEYQYWHNLLTTKWLKSTLEDQKTAICVIHALHLQIGMQLSHRNNSDDIPIVNYFSNYFIHVLRSPKSPAYEVRIAIRGYGFLATSIKTLLPSEKLDQLFTLVMQRMENAAIEIGKIDKEQLEHFPDLIEALSQIMNHVNELTGIQISILENITVSLIRHFHYLSASHHEIAANSIMKCFFNLSRRGGTILDDVLSKVIYQGVIWTCSHNLVFDAQSDWDTYRDWKDHLTYKSYLPLWNNLLANTVIADYNRPLITKKLYDSLIDVLLRLVNKLNLSTRKRVFSDEIGNSEEYFFCDPNYDLEPVKKKDFHIFFNLVQFYRQILSNLPKDIHAENFTKWTNQYFEVMIVNSCKYPLVSGFYKLIQLGLKLCNKISCFAEESRNETLDSIESFIISTVSIAQQTSGELQLSCLQMLFSTPTSILEYTLLDMIPAFQTAFVLGKTGTVLYIVNSALSAMERYVDTHQRNPATSRTFFKSVLPGLDIYLQGLSLEATSSATVELIKKKNVRAKRIVKVTESDLLKLQKRIILFIGKLEPDQCLSLIHNDESATNLVKWCGTNTMLLSLPSGDIRPTICLDTILPEICKIATTATERQKKMVACEIVHSSILYLIGSNNHKGIMWIKLCEEMLELGCDGDVAVKQMFEPLIMQVMRYMSRASQIFDDNGNVTILLSILMDGISHPAKASMRDISVRALREFVTWSIKQMDPSQIAVSPASIKVIVENLQLFSLDSSQHRRQGATLTFNNLYRLLREEHAIVSDFWLDFLHTFCTNFLMTEEFGTGGEISLHLEQLSISLDHVVRVLIAKREEFNVHKEGRVVPKAFEGNLLLDAVKWLFKQCGARQLKYRRKCIELSQKLVVHIDAYSSMLMFIQSNHTIDSLLELCEGTSNGTGIRNRPNLNHIVQTKSVTATIYNWLEHLLASLDCYIWLVENTAVQNTNEFLRKAIIFEVVLYYLKSVVMLTPLEIVTDLGIDLDCSQNINVQTTTTELKNIRSIKVLINIRIFEFLIKLLPSYHTLFGAFWEEKTSLINFILKSVFTPHRLGFEIKTGDEYQYLQKVIESVTTNICKHAAADFVKEFETKLREDTLINFMHITEISQKILSLQTVTHKDFQIARGIERVFRIQQHLKTTNLLVELFNSSSREILFELFNGVKARILDQTVALQGAPDTIQYSNQVMKIGLFKPNVYVELISLLMNREKLCLNSAETDEGISHGQHFLHLHKNTIFEYFTKAMDQSICSLIQRIQPGNIHYVLNIFIDFIEYNYKTNQYNKVLLKDIANLLLRSWPDIYSKVAVRNSDTIQLTFLELMDKVAIIYPDKLDQIATKAEGFTEWLLGILSNKDTQTDVKSKAINLLPCIIGPNLVLHTEVEKQLQCLAERNFPLDTTELTSIQKSSFISLFQAILDALCASKSLIILRFLINNSAQDHKHIMEREIQSAIQKFTRKQSPEQQIRSLNVAFKIFCDQNVYVNNRISVLKRFLLTMIRNCAVENVITFYELRIIEIVQLCDSNFRNCAYDIDSKNNLVNRLGGFELIDALFGAIPYHRILDNQSQIPVKLLGPERSRNFVGELSKKAFTVRTEYQSNDENMELHRKYQCSAFKALCTLLTVAPKTDTRYFEKFLFMRNPWKHLINTKDDVCLYIETDKKLKIKERLVSIREFKSTESAPMLPRYMESQNVIESSLSQDVIRVDFTTSAVRTEADVYAMQTMGGANTISLEDHALNNHEIMAPLCAVIQWMFEKGLTPIEMNNPRAVAPQWVQLLCTDMTDPNQPKNIRLFLAMVVDNCRHQFRNYAPTMTKFILNLMTSTLVNDSIDGLVLYLSITLMEWNEYYKINGSEEIMYASDLVSNLVKHAWHDTKAVYKKRLELIKNLVELWRDSLSLPRQYLLDSIRRFERSNPNVIINGLQINGIILANGLLPWSDSTKIEYFNLLIKCLGSTIESTIYRPASQVLGMALAKLINEPTDEEKTMKAHLETKLFSIHGESQNKFADVLFGIHKYFEPIVDSFMPHITNYIATSAGVAKRIYLEMFMSRISKVSTNLFGEIVTIGIKDLLRITEYQLLALHIINRTVSAFDRDQIRNILPNIVEIALSKNPDCRSVMYEILMYIQMNFEMCDDIVNITTPELLNGLTDPDELVQGKVFQFWSSESGLPLKLSDRIIWLFRKLYSTRTEKHFLNYSTQLLLQPAIDHTESSERIFKHRTTEDDKHREYKIDISWNTKDCMMTAPLFMESQQKVHGDYLQHNFLRATLNEEDLEFKPTLEPSTVHRSKENFTLATQSSLFYCGQTQILDRRSQRITMPLAAASLDKSSTAKIDYQLLRTRIPRKTDGIRKHVALHVIDKKNKQNKNSMKLYRRYRTGDFPDFEINSLAFLLPLQALVRTDQLTARRVMIAIFDATLAVLDTQQSSFMQAMSENFKYIFSHTKNCESILFNTMIEMALCKGANFDIQPNVLATISNANNTLPLGILYLESKLCSDVIADVSQLLWTKLASMYYNLSEHDIVADIFNDKLKSNEKLLEAIEMEASCNYASALDLYRHVINKTNDLQIHEREADFAYQSYYNCLMHLGQWELLEEQVEQQLEGNYETLWDDDWYLEHLLPHYVRCELRGILNNQCDFVRHTETQVKYIQNMEGWLRHTDRGEHIKQNFAEELMMLQLANGSYLEARVYSEKHFTRFLSEWSNLNVLSENVRSNKILNIRNVAEIHNYCNWLCASNVDSSIFENLTGRWNSTHIHPFDSISMWDTLISYRRFVNKVANEIEYDTASPMSNEPRARIPDNIFDMQFEFIEACLQQNNLHFAHKIINQFKKYVELHECNRLSAYIGICESKLNLQTSRHSKNAPEQSLQQVLDAWDEIVRTINGFEGIFRNHPGLSSKTSHHMAMVADQVLEFLPKLAVTRDINDAIISRTAPSTSAVLERRLFEYSVKYLKEAIAQAGESDFTAISPHSSYSNLGNACFNLAMFFQQKISNNLIASNEFEVFDIEMDIITYVLQGMQNESPECHINFPSILQLPHINSPDGRKRFNDEVAAVPNWMFLKWMPQILSAFNFEEECFLDKLMLRLASSYASIIVYPFRISLQQYEDQRAENIQNNRELVNEICTLLEISNPLVDKFINGIKCVCMPNKLLRSKLEHLAKMLKHQSASRHSFQTALADVLSVIFDDNIRGPLFKKIDQYAPRLNDLAAKNDVDKLKVLDVLINELYYLNISIPMSSTLDQFSSYLSQFNWCGGETYLELPGQYNYDSDPRISNQIKVYKFSKAITIHSSIRAPIKITIFGSDGKQYPYLVKHGEDLRQDQRIQQLLRIMSSQLENDRKCRNHQLSVETYEVIPMSANCGLLNFMDNVIPLHSFFEDSLGRNSNMNVHSLKDFRDRYRAIMQRPSRNIKDATIDVIYGNAAGYYSREQLIANFEFQTDCLPKQLIKMGLQDISNSPESFFALRNNFAASLAAMNIATWVLGVGDRHLQNILINNKNGKLVGIDYGIAFGSALLNLPIPEMTTFRLTPQLVDTIRPLGTSGIINKCMIHTLQALRNSSKLLMTCMEVFVKEPTINWLHSAWEKDRLNVGEMASLRDTNWEPNMRLTVVKRKLNGSNPMHIMQMELQNGVISKRPDHLTSYIRILSGDDSCIRRKMDEDNLTVKQQVACLLDIAQDKAILGISYGEMDPWI